MQINITEKDIEYAEQVLLPEKCHFDEERRVFIKDLRTLDLQAVPGSGKTTALLAKLLILGRKQPFDSNSGILVLSHTNAAVDEFKNKLGIQLPTLFQYPNFIGTIQSFVDTFLAIPYYTNKYKHPPYLIDDNIYKEICERKMNTYESFTYWIKNKPQPWQFLYELKLDSKGSLCDVSGLKDRTKPTFKGLEKFKQDTYNAGIFKFEEAFFLASEFLSEYPIFKTFLRKRFKLIFVDEMQDIGKESYDLLESLFFNENCVYQRIGDINQSIFSEDKTIGKESSFWKFRNHKLQICGSNRLNPQIAHIVQRFGIENQEIKGLKKNFNNTEITIKPYILIYEQTTITNVILKYIEIIKRLKKDNRLCNIPNEKYKVIGWRKKIENKTDEKYCISDYFPNFLQEVNKSRIDFKFLSDYLFFFDKQKKDLESIRKNILNALIKILRVENIKDENERFYTKRTMIEYIKKSNLTFYENFKKQLFIWCKNVLNHNEKNVLCEMKKYILDFLIFFNAKYSKSKSFIENESTSYDIEDILDQSENVYQQDGLEIEVQTIHSIKGQTCTGILYLETFYAKGSSKEKYESEKLYKYICGQYICSNTREKDSIQVASKMVYVGFSRPTHLLCFAVQKDRFETYLTGIDRNEWEIIYV